MTTTLPPRAKHALLLLLTAVLALLALVRPTPAHAATTGHTPTYVAWHYALAHHGDWYEWGGTGPSGFDCSGLAYASFKDAGILLPRTTYGMLGSRHLIRTSHPTTGDLAFFGSGHVELYVRPGMTYGAQQSGTRVGYHPYSGWWHPTAFYEVR
jgi:murein DD-endopeptidase